MAMLGALALLTPMPAQIRDIGPSGRGIGEEGARRMPDGKDRTLMILKSDLEKSSEDMAKVIELAKALQGDIEKNRFHTVDLRSIRKAEEIIKIVRRVKSRMTRSH